MKRDLVYLAWNVVVMGTLAAGYFFGAQKTAGLIIGILYGFILAIYFVMIFAVTHKPILDSLVNSGAHKLRLWHLCEPVFIFATYKMGYSGIFVAMVCEFGLHLCLVAMINYMIKSEYK